VGVRGYKKGGEQMNKNPLKWHLVFSIVSVLVSILAVFAAFLAENIIFFGFAVFICFFVSFCLGGVYDRWKSIQYFIDDINRIHKENGNNE
jgi:uncharacterized membrane protein HdeD (DUF308 family)